MYVENCELVASVWEMETFGVEIWTFGVELETFRVSGGVRWRQR